MCEFTRAKAHEFIYIYIYILYVCVEIVINSMVCRYNMNKQDIERMYLYMNDILMFITIWSVWCIFYLGKCNFPFIKI